MSQSKTVSYHSWIWGGQSSDVSQLSRISTPLENWWCFVLLWGTRCLAESIHEWRFGASPRERSVAETPRQYVARELERTRGCGGHTQERPRRRQTRCWAGVRGVSFLDSFLLFGLIASYIQCIFILYLMITWQIGVGPQDHQISYELFLYCTGPFEQSCRMSVIGCCRARVQV